jgi:ABC-type branched-subunit amino acid transport system permease subunit
MWTYAVAALVAIGFAAFASTTWIFLACAGFILAIAGMGLTVLIGWGGEVSLTQAALVGTAAYVSGYAVRADGFGWPYLAAAALGLVTVVALSALVSLPTAKLSGIYVLVLTLGLQVTIERTLFTNGKFTGGLESVHTGRPALFGIGLDSDRAYYFLPLLVMIGVMIGLRLFRTSRHGRALMMVGRDRRAAAAMGISPLRYKILAFMIAGALAGIAGALTTPLYRSPPTSIGYISVQSLFYLAVPVTAGFGSLGGVVVVALLFTVTPYALGDIVRISPLLLGGTGLMLGTYVGPGGISGVVLDRLRARREAVVLSGARSREAPAARAPASVSATN